MDWVTNQLLPNLEILSLILLDNAKYHKSEPVGTPNAAKLRKFEVLTWLKIYGIQHEEKIIAIEAKMLLRMFVDDNIKAAIVQKSEEAGHKVIFTPHEYSDLQSIELVRNRFKGNIGRQYTNSTKMSEVKERLNYQFELPSGDEGRLAISAIRRHVESIDNSLPIEIEEVENLEEGNVDDDEKTNSDNFSLSDCTVK